MAPNNRNLFSHSSGVQKSEIKMPAGLVPSEVFENLLCSTCLASGGGEKKVKVLATQLCPTLRPYGLQPTSLLCSWNSTRKDTKVGCHSLFQGIFLTQGSTLGLLLCRQALYYMSYQRNQLLVVVSNPQHCLACNCITLIPATLMPFFPMHFSVCSIFSL